MCSSCAVTWYDDCMTLSTVNLRVALPIVVALSIASALILAAYYSTSMQQVVGGHNELHLARYHIARIYKPVVAAEWYRSALRERPADIQVMYELARTESVLGNHAEAVRLAEHILALDPTHMPIRYVGALAAGSLKDYVRAEAWLTEFIAQPDAQWQSRLDLAWVYFMQDKFSESKELLLATIDRFGENAWLLTALGASHIAEGEKDAARSVLVRASESAKKITNEVWRANYGFNDPAVVEKSIAEFKEVIQTNIRIAGGEQSIAPQIPPFAHTNTGGYLLGITVAACGEACGPVTCTSAANACGATSQQIADTCIGQTCAALNLQPPPLPPGYGSTCSAANVCGFTGTGTVGCSGQCEASAGLPAGFGTACSVTTSCGVVPGRINCNGQCNVSRMNTCPGVIIIGDESEDEEFDEFGNRVPRLGCAAAKVKIKALPLLVRKGKVTAIQWLANEAVSCTVTGGGQTWTGLQGVEITNPIQDTTRFTITCQPMAQCTGDLAQPFSASVEVKVVPDWQEI